MEHLTPVGYGLVYKMFSFWRGHVAVNWEVLIGNVTLQIGFSPLKFWSDETSAMMTLRHPADPFCSTPIEVWECLGWYGKSTVELEWWTMMLARRQLRRLPVESIRPYHQDALTWPIRIMCPNKKAR